MLSGGLANPAAAQLPLDGHDTDPTPIARPSRVRRLRPGRARTRHLRLPGRLLPPFRYPRASASRSRPPRGHQTTLRHEPRLLAEESRLVLMTRQEENELSAAGRHETGTFLVGSRNGMAAVWPVTEPSDASIRSSVPGPACSTGTQT
jgi:hypothetical protein